MWLMPRIASLKRKIAAYCDPYWDKVVLAMHMDALPFSCEKGTVISSGGALPTLAAGKFESAAGFSGAQSLIAPALNIRGNFTIEFWLYAATHTSGQRGVFGEVAGADYSFMSISQAGDFSLTLNGGGDSKSLAGIVPLNRWVHVAFVNDDVGDVSYRLRSYIGGKFLAATTYFSGVAFPQDFYIGAYDASSGLIGKLDDFLITKVAKYTADFTPPDRAFPDVACAPVPAVWSLAKSASNIVGGFLTEDGSRGVAVDTGGWSTLYASGAWGTSQNSTISPNLRNPVVGTTTGTLLYSVDTSGYARKSTDYGATWTRISTQMSFIPMSIACSEDGQLVVIAQSNESGIWISANAGSAWTNLASASGVTQCVCCVASATKTIYFVASGDASTLYKSTDSGATWTSSATGISGMVPSSIECSADGQVVLIAGTSAGGGSYLSKDSGATWGVTGAGISAAQSCAVSSDGTVLMVAKYSVAGASKVSADGGSTWATPSLLESQQIKNCQAIGRRLVASSYAASGGLLTYG